MSQEHPAESGKQQLPPLQTSSCRLADMLGAPAPPRPPGSIEARIADLVRSGLSEQEVLADLAKSPPPVDAKQFQEFRAELADMVCKNQDRFIVAFTDRKFKARENGDSKIAEAWDRKIRELTEARTRFLKYLESQEFAGRYAENRRLSKGFHKEEEGGADDGLNPLDVLQFVNTMGPKEFDQYIGESLASTVRKEVENAERKGGRPRGYEKVWRVICKMPDASNEEIAAICRHRFSRDPAIKNITPAKIKEITDNYRRREKNHE